MEQIPALAEGMQALDRADWESARAAFESVLAAGESADARAGLGQAMWFLGDIAGAIAMRERAFEEPSTTAAAATPRASRCGSRTST